MNHIFQEIKSILKLAVPAFLAQISMVSMGFVDMVMTGHVGSVDMAAVSLAGSLWLPILLFCQGILMAVTPLTAQNHGAGDLDQSGHVIRQGLYLSLIMGVLCTFSIIALSFVLEKLGVEGKLANMTSQYLQAIAWGAIPFLCFAGLTCGLEGLGLMKPAMFAGLLGLFVNIPCNYILIFGKYGFPQLGGVGAGYATAFVYWVMFLVILIYAKWSAFFKKFVQWADFHGLEGATVKKIIKIGLPGALAILLEVSLFAGVALLLAPFGSIVVAGHQVALNVSNFIFMIPFSLSIAATVRTGFGIGKKSLAMVKLTTRTAVGLAVTGASITAACTILFRTAIAQIYGGGQEVILLATELLIYDAIYQIPDAAQYVCVGILRGYNDTRALFFISLISYWILALPIGIVLGRTSLIVKPLSAAGFWIGFLVGIFSAFFMLAARVRFLERIFETQ